MQRQSAIVGAVFGSRLISDKIICYLAGGGVFDIACWAMTCQGICQKVADKIFSRHFHWVGDGYTVFPPEAYYAPQRQSVKMEALKGFLARAKRAKHKVPKIIIIKKKPPSPFWVIRR